MTITYDQVLASVKRAHEQNPKAAEAAWADFQCETAEEFADSIMDASPWEGDPDWAKKYL